ncbi:MAG: hypothetical protein QUS13_04755 [Smithella sp.]|nr:hypothetical protein [Smithella sp.]
MNDLYEEKGSWWQTIVDDDQVFILVRKNELHVLIQGALLLKITMDNRYGLVCKTHEKHLSSGAGNTPYVKTSTDHKRSPYRCIEGDGLTEFVNHYDRIINLMNLVHADDQERQCCHTMSMNIKEIFEREFGLVLEDEDIKRKRAQFVDLEAVSNDGKMVFVEVKLLSNNEILPLNMRSAVNKDKKYVVTQLKKYEDIIKSHKQKIREAYAEQYETYLALNGAFFDRRFPAPEKIKISPTVRLIITKFEEAPGRKSLLPRIRAGIEEGMKWKENTDNLIIIDNPNAINAGHIFKGIQECELI